MSTPTPATFADGFLVPTEAKEDKKRNPPKPLNGTPPKADPFPIQQLPVIIRDAVDEVQQATQAPEALVVSCALSAVSAAAPPATIYRDEGLDGPTSLFIMTVAKSGERKTACDKLFTRTLQQFGPVRDKLKLGEAIDCLGAHDRLFKKSDGQKREVFFHIDVLKEWGMPPLRKMEW